MEHGYSSDDKVLVCIYDFDANGYDKFYQVPAEIVSHVHGYGYNVKLNRPMDLNIISLPITPFDSCCCCEEKQQDISVAYNEIIDYIPNKSVTDWDTMDAIKNRWKNLVFRYVKPSDPTKLIKKNSMGDKHISNIICPSESYINFSMFHCWFVPDTLNYDYSQQNMVVGLVYEKDKKTTYKVWSYCNERLFYLWCIFCLPSHPSTCKKNPLKSLEQYSDLYMGLGEYILYNRPSVCLPKEFEDMFKKTILWYKDFK